VTKYPRKPKAGKVCLDSVLEASVHDWFAPSFGVYSEAAHHGGEHVVGQYYSPHGSQEADRQGGRKEEGARVSRYSSMYPIT
jgi:hypothetical protein